MASSSVYFCRKRAPYIDEGSQLGAYTVFARNSWSGLVLGLGLQPARGLHSV
jgi:hypothetical protein